VVAGLLLSLAVLLEGNAREGLRVILSGSVFSLAAVGGCAAVMHHADPTAIARFSQRAFGAIRELE
jgi:hypothetical protein